MVPWIQVFSNMVNHPKTYKLADLLEIKCKEVSPNVIACGMMVSLWSWCSQNAVDGDLSNVTPQCIADAAGWKGLATLFCSAIASAGFADDDGDRYTLHDWEVHAALLIGAEANKKEKDRERSKRYREKKRHAGDRDETVTRHADVRDEITVRHAPTIPNLTIPNQEDKSILFSSEERKEEKEKKPDGEAGSDWQEKRARAYAVLDKLYPEQGYGDA